jgi:hypothetical protein
MNIEELETTYAWNLVVEATDYVETYAIEEDTEASVVALLTRALELATGKTVFIESMFKNE